MSQMVALIGMVARLEKIIDIVSENVISLRKLRGLTQEQLAEKANLSLGTIQKLEYKERWPGLETIAALAQVLQVSEATLFQVQNPPAIPPNLSEAVQIVLSRILLIDDIQLKQNKMGRVVDSICKTLQSPLS